MDKTKIRKITSIFIGLLLSVVLLFFGFQIMSKLFTKASGEAPTDVTITNINQSAASIKWTTPVETQGVIEYGTSLTSLNFFAPETQSTKTHSVDLTLLARDTTYFFQIRIGDRKYGIGGASGGAAENGQPWDFKTKSNSDAATAPEASPTAIVTLIPTKPVGLTPTPVSSVRIPDGTESAPTCPVTSDCEAIKALLAKGCQSADYLNCLSKVTPTKTP